MLTLNLLRPFCLSLWSVSVYRHTCLNPQFEGIYVLCVYIYICIAYICVFLSLCIYVCMYAYIRTCMYMFKAKLSCVFLNEYMKEH